MSVFISFSSFLTLVAHKCHHHYYRSCGFVVVFVVANVAVIIAYMISILDNEKQNNIIHFLPIVSFYNFSLWITNATIEYIQFLEPEAYYFTWKSILLAHIYKQRMKIYMLSSIIEPCQIDGFYNFTGI